MSKVWIVEDSPPYEDGKLLGIYATEELARQAAACEKYQDYITVYDEDVLTELPKNLAPPKPSYQVIP